jgi:hypothetical protein
MRRRGESIAPIDRRENCSHVEHASQYTGIDHLARSDSIELPTPYLDLRRTPKRLFSPVVAPGATAKNG